MDIDDEDNFVIDKSKMAEDSAKSNIIFVRKNQNNYVDSDESEIAIRNVFSLKEGVNKEKNVIRPMKITEKHKRKPNKEYICDICKMNFFQIPAFEAHLKIHSMNKHWYCDKCDCSFTFKEELKEHKNNVYSRYKSNSRFDCNICEFKSCLKTSLKIHKIEKHRILRAK